MGWICLALAVGLSALTLRLGFVLDDYMQLAATDGVMLPSRPLNYFTFVHTPAEVHAFVDRGPLPWWTLPELRLRFFRPLSSALIYFDHTFLGRTAWVHHVHSGLWFVLLIFAISTLYKRAIPEASAALALLLFTLDDAHMMPVAWLANRNSLVSAVACVFALAAHLKWREQGWAPGRWLAWLGLAVGLTGGESALAFTGYFAAYELVRGKGWAGAARGFAPFVGVLVVWAIVYRSLGYGAYGSGTYLDPGIDPLGYLQSAPPRLFALLGALTLNITSDLWLLLPHTRPYLVVAGVVGTTLLATTLKGLWPLLSADDRRAVRWLSLGALAALIPGLATFPLDRMLLPASVGAMGVFAILLRAAWQRRKRAWAVVAWLGILNIVMPPLSWLVSTTIIDRYARASEQAVLSEPADRFEGRVVLLTASDPAPAIYGPLYLGHHGRPRPDRWWTLSMSPQGHQVTRVGDKSLELKVIDGRLLDTVFEQLMRSDAFGFSPGQVVTLDGLRVTVLEVDEGHPTRLRADFDLPLEAHRLLIWKNGAFVQISAPALDETLTLPPEPPLFELAFRNG